MTKGGKVQAGESLLTNMEESSTAKLGWVGKMLGSTPRLEKLM